MSDWATRKQPAPKPGITNVVDTMLETCPTASLECSGPAVVEDLRARQAVGIETYGTPLQTFNGRDALVDAYQEALDLCVYLGQALMESQDVMEAFADAFHLAVKLREALEAAEEFN